MGRQLSSHSVTFHPTQVNTHRRTQPDKLVLDLSTPEGWKAEFTYRWLVIVGTYLSADSHPYALCHRCEDLVI